MSIAAHAGLMTLGGGGGGAGLAPTTYAGLTFWLDMSAGSTVWADSAATTPATAGGIVSRVDSVSATRCIFGNADGGYQSGSPAYLHLGPNYAYLDYYNNRPVGANPTTQATLGNLRTTSVMNLIYAIRINDGNPDGGAAYANDPLFWDSAGWMFIATYKSGGNGVIDVYQEVSGGKTVRMSETLGTWMIVTVQHQSGNLRIRKNGGAWTTIACGALPSVAGSPISFCRAPAVRDVDIAQHCIYNASRTDAELLNVERYFGAKVGLSF